MMTFYKVALKKSDGRDLFLYSMHPLDKKIEAPTPNLEKMNVNPHLRWHPLRGEWVGYAAHRQDRTFLPPKEYNPLAPMKTHPTELPSGDYEVAVFENLFPTLSMSSAEPPKYFVPTRAATGRCEVVVFTQDESETLGNLSLENIELILNVWADRYSELSRLKEIKYILPFENRGVEVGVTLHHPHGQIYAYPFIPPIPAAELLLQKKFMEETGTDLISDLIEKELNDGRRIIFSDNHVVAFVPVCARYPYEVWISTKRNVTSLPGLNPDEFRSLSKALKTVLLKYDGLWNRPFPYLMAIHQAPTNQGKFPYCHLHFEFYPPYRSQGRLKYLAGTELGAGMFANDSLPEEKAAELQNVKIAL